MQNEKLPPQQKNVLHLRLDEALREQLQKAADAHRFPLIREIRHRLIDSFTFAAERENHRRIENVILDLEIVSHRLGAKLVRLDLGDQLADAVAKDGDPEKIKSLAHLIIEHKAGEQRMRGTS